MLICMGTRKPRSEETKSRGAIERWLNEGGCATRASRAPRPDTPLRSIGRRAFVRPVEATCPSPPNDLALLTAADSASHGRSDVQLSLVTAEQEPLAIFSTTVSDEIGRLMADRAITMHTGSYGVPRDHGWADIFPGKGIAFDRVATEPRLIGPRLRGIPCTHDGLIHTDPHGRVPASPTSSPRATRPTSRSSRVA